MPSRAHYDALWRSLPEGLEPADFALRRRFLLERVSPGERVLDVGCGEGSFAAELVRAGARVAAIDVAAEALRRARTREPTLDTRLLEGDDAWPLQDASFDVVWAGEVIEHVADTAAWLSEARRVLRSGGTLLLSTPANGPLALIAAALWPAAFAARFDPTGDHLRFYSRATLSRLLQELGFEDVELRCAGGLPGARRVLLVRAIRSRF